MVVNLNVFKISGTSSSNQSVTFDDTCHIAIGEQWSSVVKLSNLMCFSDE